MSNLIDRDKLIERLRWLSETKPLPAIDKQLLGFVEEVIDGEPTVNEWIPVSERLPDDEGLYLACVFNNETNTLEGYGVEPYYQDVNERFIWGLEMIKGQPFRVIAWKPIEPFSKW